MSLENEGNICFVDKLSNCYKDVKGRKQIKCEKHKTPLKWNDDGFWCISCEPGNPVFGEVSTNSL